MIPHEEFVGLYRVSETTGQGIAKVAADVLLRLNLPMSGLHGQTYDGASNMAGKYTGAQAILRSQQPLALYIDTLCQSDYTSWLLGLHTELHAQSTQDCAWSYFTSFCSTFSVAIFPVNIPTVCAFMVHCF